MLIYIHIYVLISNSYNSNIFLFEADLELKIINEVIFLLIYISISINA